MNGEIRGSIVFMGGLLTFVTSIVLARLGLLDDAVVALLGVELIQHLLAWVTVVSVVGAVIVLGRRYR